MNSNSCFLFVNIFVPYLSYLCLDFNLLHHTCICHAEKFGFLLIFAEFGQSLDCILYCEHCTYLLLIYTYWIRTAICSIMLVYIVQKNFLFTYLHRIWTAFHIMDLFILDVHVYY